MSHSKKCYIDGGPCDCNAWDVASACPKDDFENEDDDTFDPDYDGLGVDPETEYEARLSLQPSIGEYDDAHYRL